MTRAHEEFVAPGEYAFRTGPNGGRIENVLLVSWEMVATASGHAVGGGTDMLLLDGNERMLVDYQFIGDAKGRRSMQRARVIR